MSLKEALFVVENHKWILSAPLPDSLLPEPRSLKHPVKRKIITVHGSPRVELGFGALGSLLKQSMS
jgi:hypothetical protein